MYVCSFSDIKHRDEAVSSSSSVLNYIHLVMSWVSCDFDIHPLICCDIQWQHTAKKIQILAALFIFSHLLCFDDDILDDNRCWLQFKLHTKAAELWMAAKIGSRSPKCTFCRFRRRQEMLNAKF